MIGVLLDYDLLSISDENYFLKMLFLIKYIYPRGHFVSNWYMYSLESDISNCLTDSWDK